MFSAFTYLNNSSDASLVGVVGLTGVDLVNRRGEFSCYIDPDKQGMGFGTRALKVLFAYGFDVLGLNLIWGETFQDNPAAKVFEKLGMTKHGVRPDFYFREGKFIDAHLYGLRRSEWVR
jgi:diamine N-acetyltransferase